MRSGRAAGRQRAAGVGACARLYGERRTRCKGSLRYRCEIPPASGQIPQARRAFRARNAPPPATLVAPRARRTPGRRNRSPARAAARPRGGAEAPGSRHQRHAEPCRDQAQPGLLARGLLDGVHGQAARLEQPPDEIVRDRRRGALEPEEGLARRPAPGTRGRAPSPGDGPTGTARRISCRQSGSEADVRFVRRMVEERHLHAPVAQRLPLLHRLQRAHLHPDRRDAARGNGAGSAPPRAIRGSRGRTRATAGRPRLPRRGVRGGACDRRARASRARRRENRARPP